MARGRSRSLITLLFAAVFGIAAAGLSIYALQLARPTEAAVVETVSVLVPRETIPQRTLLRAEMLTQITVPVDVRHPQAVTSLGQAVGKVSKQNLVAGEQLLASKLSSQKEESGLALVIPADQRAVSVEVSEITGSGGLILPGDRVDVLAVCTTRIEANTSGRDGEDETVSENAGADSDVPQHAGGDLSRVATPLQNVVVLAVAQTINGSAPQNEDEDGDTQPEAKTVTLAVAPDDAQTLVLHEKLCDLRLALRPADDHTILDLDPQELYYDIVGEAPIQ